MNRENIIFITGNYGKYASAKEKFASIGVTVEQIDLDIEELAVSDVQEVSLDKAKKAYTAINQPCFVEDSGFYIDAYPGKTNYPGTLVKRTGISQNVEKLLEIMKDIPNRNCHFLSCVTFYDGKVLHQFITKNSGTLSYEVRGELKKEAKSRLFQVFIPQGSTKTLAEIQSEGAKKNKTSKSSMQDFVNWYNDNLSVKCKKKIK